MKDLRAYTSARVSLGQAGDSLPTKHLLEMRLAHARAKDAVERVMSGDLLGSDLAKRGWPSVVLKSAARDHGEYLRRPDLGRRLDASSVNRLECMAPQKIVFAIGDGLSVLAIERHAIPLLAELFSCLLHVVSETHPVLIVKHARVAIGDMIGASLRADVSVMLIGERPGLSSPDSLGIYLTWRPRMGRKDSERNCISNIHEAGISYQLAARKAAFLIGEMRQRRLSGVLLKDTLSAGLPALPDSIGSHS